MFPEISVLSSWKESLSLDRRRERERERELQQGRKGFRERERERKLMDDAGVSSSSSMDMASASLSLSFSDIFQNYPLVSALLAFSIAQFIKFFTTWYKERRWDAKRLIGSGGMPSSHSVTVAALAVAIGFQEGFGSSMFATAMILACVVMYDAVGVRLHAGRQAEILMCKVSVGINLSLMHDSDWHLSLHDAVLNQIVYELPAEHPLADTRPLRELLGHTPPQVVAGGLLGFMTAAVTQIVGNPGS